MEKQQNANQGIWMMLLESARAKLWRTIYLGFFTGLLICSCTKTDTDFLTEREMENKDYRFKLKAPDHWFFLKAPNSILEYPQAAAQLADVQKKAFCILIPETFDPQKMPFSLELFADIVKKTIREKEPSAQFTGESQSASDWGQRKVILYSSKYGINSLVWTVVLDGDAAAGLRLMCWCKKVDYSAYQKDFESIIASLHKIEK